MPRAHNSTGPSSPSNSTDGPTRVQGFKPNGLVNGLKKHSVKPQRVPTSDEVPSLGDPSRSPGPQLTNGHSGLTAAQVLQAPPPGRKDPIKDLSPEHNGSLGDSSKVALNSASFHSELKFLQGVDGKGSVPSPDLDKISVSFTAAARGAVDTGKELTVSA